MLFLIALAIATSSARILDCPTPLRPGSALSVVNYNESDSLEIILESRLCLPTDSERDLFFRLQYFAINGEEGFLPEFKIYEGLSRAPVSCVFQLIYERNSTILTTQFRERLPYGNRFAIYICDYMFSNCNLLVWKCPGLSRGQYEVMIPIYLSEMLIPLERWNALYLDSSTQVSVFRDMRNNTIVLKEHKATWWGYYVIGFVLITLSCGFLQYLDL